MILDQTAREERRSGCCIAFPSPTRHRDDEARRDMCILNDAFVCKTSGGQQAWNNTALGAPAGDRIWPLSPTTAVRIGLFLRGNSRSAPVMTCSNSVASCQPEQDRDPDR